MKQLIFSYYHTKKQLESSRGKSGTRTSHPADVSEHWVSVFLFGKDFNRNRQQPAARTRRSQVGWYLSTRHCCIVHHFCGGAVAWCVRGVLEVLSRYIRRDSLHLLWDVCECGGGLEAEILLSVESDTRICSFAE